MGNPAVAAPSEGRKDLALLVALIIFACALRTWMICRTEVAARDSIGYIRQALLLETQPWGEQFRLHHQHPGYPIAILGMSYPVRWLCGGITPQSMQLTAQLVTSLAAILLVIPMYLLGRFLYDRRVGFWSAVLFQVMPVSCQLLSDGTSEGLFLLLLTVSMLFAAWGMDTRRPWLFLVCGLSCGLAYFARPEGAVVALAAGMALFAAQLSSRWRTRWSRWALCGGALALGTIGIGGIYVAIIGGISNKPAVGQIIGESSAHAPSPMAARATGSSALLACLWADSWDLTGQSQGQKLVRSFWAVVREVTQAFQYHWGVFYLIGIFSFRMRMWNMPGAWVSVFICFIYLGVLCALGSKTGYVSDRHVMVIVLLGVYPTVAAILAAPGWCYRWWRTHFAGGVVPSAGNAMMVKLGLAVLLAMIATCLPEALKPLHGNRAGHHAAGLWLAERIRPGDTVADDHAWAHYYAGMVFEEGKSSPTPQSSHYIVISRSRNREKAMARDVQEQEIRSGGGALVYHWPVDRLEEKAQVVVYLAGK